MYGLLTTARQLLYGKVSRQVPGNIYRRYLGPHSCPKESAHSTPSLDIEQLDNNAGERAKAIPNGLVPTIEGRQGKALLSPVSKRLSAEHREVIDLVYYHKRSIGEVGKIFGLSEGLVKSRM